MGRRRSPHSGGVFVPQQKAYEPGEHKRETARFGHVLGSQRDGDAQVVADDLRTKRVAKKGIIAPLESMRSSLSCQRVDVSQCIAGMQDAKVNVGRYGMDIARTDEIAHERVEQRAVRSNKIDISEIQKRTGAVRDLSFKFAQAEFETASCRKAAIGMSNHCVYSGAGLGRFGETGIVTMGRDSYQLHLKRRDVQVQRNIDSGDAVIDEGLRPERLPDQLTDHVLARVSGTAKDQLADAHAAIPIRFCE